MNHSVNIFSLYLLCSFASSTRPCTDLTKHRNFNLLPKPPNCGPVFPKDFTKVMGGEDARVGEFPWMVSLYKETIKGLGSRDRFCDGTILTTRYVITAAHCLQPYLKMNRFYLYVRLGQYDVTENSSTTVEMPVNVALIHEQYDRISHVHDIGLVRVKKHIQFNNETIYPICLPITCDVMSMDLSQREMVLAGWGLTQKQPVPVEAGVLQKTAMQAVPEDECQKSWGTRLKVIPEHICARGCNSSLQSACQGDSGGPLMVTVKRSTYLVGVISMGDVCSSEKPTPNPNVFTSIVAHIEWVLNNMFL